MEVNKSASPIKICHDVTLGRYLASTRSIQPGEIIIREPPLVRGPFLHTIPVCLGCGKILNYNNSMPCTKCGWPVCGHDCEKSAAHEPECVLTAAKGSKITIKNFGIPHPNYQFITILRSLYLKQQTPELWVKLKELQFHPTTVNLAPPSFMREFFKLENWSEDEIEKVSGILTVNGHELPLTQPPQLVVYDTASLLEHNCRANCTKTFTVEGEVLVVASESIQEGDHLSICYTDPFWGTANRRQHLHQTKQFWCTCSRCEDPAESGTHLNSCKCPNRPCDGFLLPKTFLKEVEVWNCDKCDGTFPSDNIALILEKIGADLAKMVKGDTTVCKQFIRKYEKVLPPNHFYMVDVKIALAHMLATQKFEELDDGDLRLLLELSEDLRVVAEKIAPAERRFLGLILSKYAKASIEIARRTGDQEEYQAALTNGKEIMLEACRLLENEPALLPEGRIHRQIELELKLMDNLLNK